MAISLIIAAVAGLVGAGGHLNAKETNERAQQLASESNKMYRSSQEVLAAEQRKTDQAMLRLGSTKKRVLDGAIACFLKAYKRIKDVELRESVGLDELANFSINSQDALQLQKMSDIYSSAFAVGAVGAATGIAALAVSGSFAATGALSAGATFAAGGVGATTGLAGSAASIGASIAPLAYIAAPVVVFTAISANKKADENLEKAQTMYEQTRAACEKMAVAETLCIAVTERSNMYNKLLNDLNVMYSVCVVMLDEVTRRKQRRAFGRSLTSADFTEDEMKLIAVTRALTGAVKAVIDTPILSEDRETVSEESQTVYENAEKALPSFSNQVNEVKMHDYQISQHAIEARSKRINREKVYNVQTPEQRKKRAIAAARAAYCGAGVLVSLALLVALIFLPTIIVEGYALNSIHMVQLVFEDGLAVEVRGYFAAFVLFIDLPLLFPLLNLLNNEKKKDPWRTISIVGILMLLVVIGTRAEQAAYATTGFLNVIALIAIAAGFFMKIAVGKKVL